MLILILCLLLGGFVEFPDLTLPMMEFVIAKVTLELTLQVTLRILCAVPHFVVSIN